MKVMCNFCSKEKPKNESRINPPDHKNTSIAHRFDAIIEGDKIIFSYDAYSTDSSFHEIVDIKFCPMCGKSLCQTDYNPTPN